MSDPWSRQPCDDEEAYAAFERWLTSARPRRFYLPGLRPQQLRDWHDANGWAARALAYDQAEAAARDAARLERVREHARKQADDHAYGLGELRSFALLELEKLIKASLDSEQPTLKPEMVLKYLEKAISMERVAKGQANEVIQVDAPDYSKLTDEELAVKLALEKKARGIDPG